MGILILDHVTGGTKCFHLSQKNPTQTQMSSLKPQQFAKEQDVLLVKAAAIPIAYLWQISTVR